MIDTSKNKTYLALYRNKNWVGVREEVFKIDDFTCQHCFRSKSDGVTLQVHHKQYLKDKNPWEYPLNLMETICKGCHAAQHGIIPPREGWTLYSVDNLNDLSGICDYCGQAIRYVYLIGHESWSLMEVGSDCCDKLTNTDLASQDERRRKSFNQRKKTFISSKRWHKSPFCYERLQEPRVIFEIFKEKNYFLLKVNGIKGKKQFSSAIETKAHIFNWKELDAIGYDNFLRKNPLKPIFPDQIF